MSQIESTSLSELLKRHRVDAGLTQEELAERARISTRSVSDMERGINRRPHDYTLLRLVQALDLAIQDRALFEEAARKSLSSPADGPEDAGATPMQRLPIGGYLGSLPSVDLVGREAEQAQLLALVETVAAGEGRLVMLAGEPGVGKTRLGQEAALYAHRRGLLVAAGRCNEPQQAVPYYPFLDILTAAYQVAPPSIRSEVPHRWPYLGRLLPDEPELGPGPESLASGAGSTGSEEQRLIRNVTGFLQEVASTQPLALLCDDLHWADSASLQLLLHLARHARASRLFILGTYRDVDVGPDHPLRAALDDLSREGLVERMTVSRLGREDTAALVAQLLDERAISDGVLALVHGPTEGNPFFVQQVVRSLVEQGTLYRQSGRWERRDPAEVSVPETVRSVIARRVLRLEGTTQRVLTEASVLGQSFEFEELQRLGDRPEHEVEAALEEATRAGLVRETAPDLYSFSHVLAQQAIYGEMSGRRQQRLHRAAGEALERLPERELERRAADLALHFVQGGDPERALRYFLVAGKGAEAVFAHKESYQQYRRAAELARELGDRGREAEAEWKIGQALVRSSRFDQALERLEHSVTVYQSLGDLEGEAAATYWIGQAHGMQGLSRDVLERMLRLVQTLEAKGPSPGLALLYVGLSLCHGDIGDYNGSLSSAQRASDVARAIGDEHLLTEAEALRQQVLWFLGRHVDALRAIEHLIPLVEALRELPLLVPLYANAGLACFFEGKFVRSEAYLQRCLDVSRQVDSEGGIATALSMLAFTRFIMGEWREARADLEEALALGHDVATAPALWTLGHLSVCEGNWEEGSRYLHEALAITEPTGDIMALRVIQLFLANLDLLQGHAGAAIARLTPLLDRPGLEELHVTPLLPILARGHLEHGEIARADDLAVDALRRTTAQQNEVDLASALLVLGLVRARQGRWEEAKGALKDVIAKTRAMGLPHGEGIALYEYGLICLECGEEESARRHVREARAIFLRLGARKDLERADVALHSRARSE